MSPGTGKILLFFGLILVGVGLIIYIFGDYLRKVGRLPGDIHIEEENFTFYFPVVTLILFSIVVSLLIKIFKIFF